MNSIKSRIGIFGGTFNPIHEGHIAIVDAALRKDLSKVIVLPCWLSPHKLTQAHDPMLASGEHRYYMVKEALRGKLDEREEDGEQCGVSKLVIGPRIRAILDQCPTEGFLFPSLRHWSSAHRTTEFARRCRLAGVKNRQLKSYRYAWAQRAREAGMPEREAMNHLGHKSRAVHWAYARDAKSVSLPLEHYEQMKDKKVIDFDSAQDALAVNVVGASNSGDNSTKPSKLSL